MSTLRAMWVLGLLGSFGPLSMDLYMPQLPHLAASLGTSDALAQATMSACMIGLGVGQLISGPLSDRLGRRPPMLVGVIAFTVLSAVCAVAPNVELLLAARFLQGMAGSVGIVVCMAIARDMFTGVELSRMLSLLLLVSGATPIVAPLLGGQLAHFMDWRGVFWVLAGIGAALLVLALLTLPETLRADDRHEGGFGVLLGHAGILVRDRLYMSILVASAVSSIGFFAYLSMSSFVLEGEFGLSPQQFSFVFAALALANILGAQVNRGVVARFGPRAVYVGSTALAAAATAAMLGLALVGAGVIVAGVLLAVFMMAGGASRPNSSTLSLTHHGSRAGMAGALSGLAFSLGPVVVPLIALIGTDSVMLAATMAGSSLLTLAIVWFFVRPASRELAR